MCNSTSNVNVISLIEQLRSVSAVKDKEVPIFASDTFERVSDIKSLWQILSGHWTIFDYDILKLVFKFTKCEEAKRIFNNFLLKIDPALIDDVDLVMFYKVYERSGFTKPLLRVKLKADICNLR